MWKIVGGTKPTGTSGLGVINFANKNTDSKSFDSTTSSGVVTTATPTAGDYYLYLEWPTAIATATEVFVISLTVTGNAAGRTAPILKQTSVLGKYRYHRVYFSNPTNITLTASYSDATQQAFLNSVGLISMRE